MNWHLRRPQPYIWLLLAAALVARALLPAGWMPVTNGGEIRVALCTSTGPSFAFLARDGSLHEHPSDQPERDPCPFALAAGPATDVPPADLPTALVPTTDRAAPSFETTAEIIRRTLRPPARGPPGLA
jgi:hypothetical protein